DPPHGRVQRGEELVGHQDPGARERVHQRGLARVRVTGDRDLGYAGSLAARALDLASAGQVLEVPAELGDAPLDVLAVDLELGLAAAEARPDATAQPRHRLAPAA